MRLENIDFEGNEEMIKKVKEDLEKFPGPTFECREINVSGYSDENLVFIKFHAKCNEPFGGENFYHRYGIPNGATKIQIIPNNWEVQFEFNKKTYRARYIPYGKS
jgi:hypothetical protein